MVGLDHTPRTTAAGTPAASLAAPMFGAHGRMTIACTIGSLDGSRGAERRTAPPGRAITLDVI